MKDFSYITNSHPAYIESLYRAFEADPNSVDADLKKFFEGFDFAVNIGAVSDVKTSANGTAVSAGNLSKEFAVYQLIQAYRKKGHLIAKTNPIRPRKDRKANLDLSYFGLSDADLATKFDAGKFIGLEQATLKDILAKLTKCYASSVGVEYSALNDMERIQWLADAVETRFAQPFGIEDRRRILEKLNQGVLFEKFLHTKYIGQKRFSLEGGENTIPALDSIISTSAKDGVEEVIIGMAHRGRLNVLANILGKTYEQIFTEFEGKAVPDTTMGSGDVKYHMGYSGVMETADGHRVNLKLAPNPSHLEAVDPVVLGFARAKADVIYNSDYKKVLPILIHGDASVAGQGIVYEIVQMSNLRGYYTGGT
ncbi:MAG TPA: 2-oxoglutarate dehydrogenase E1 component, partial [Chitinophagaceae bacterium]|nr:2-oxoglutarate dehydrogenase E1 component [Chitinophagaceae bacterium]